MAQRRFRRARLRWLPVLAGLCLGCQATRFGHEDGQVAVRINGVPITSQYLHTAREELSSYAQERFSGAQGDRALVTAIVDLHLLGLKAKASGADTDPRTAWTVVDTLAARMARGVKERQLPRQAFASDERALGQYLLSNAESLQHPEQRIAEIALVDDWSAGQALYDQRDTARLTRTKAMTRDDAGYPVFHRLLFDPALQPGQWLAAPAPFAGKVAVARLVEVVPARPFDLLDPQDRARVVDAAIQAPQDQALEAYLQELRLRWPLATSLR